VADHERRLPVGVKVEDDPTHRAAFGQIGLLGVAAGNQEGTICIESGVVERLERQGPVHPLDAIEDGELASPFAWTSERSLTPATSPAAAFAET
jgi:hypothetical protein